MKPKNFDIANPDWKQEIPVPVFEEKPEYLDLYWKAWDLARAHVKDIPGMPQNPYMDEAFIETDIWIWDTCFMMFFPLLPHFLFLIDFCIQYTVF